MKKLNLKDASLMTDSEMKMIVGGAEEIKATCSAKCSNGDVSISCKGKCTADDEVGVFCEDGQYAKCPK